MCRWRLRQNCQHTNNAKQAHKHFDCMKSDRKMKKRQFNSIHFTFHLRWCYFYYFEHLSLNDATTPLFVCNTLYMCLFGIWTIDPSCYRPDIRVARVSSKKTPLKHLKHCSLYIVVAINIPFSIANVLLLLFLFKWNRLSIFSEHNTQTQYRLTLGNCKQHVYQCLECTFIESTFVHSFQLRTIGHSYNWLNTKTKKQFKVASALFSLLHSGSPVLLLHLLLLLFLHFYFTTYRVECLCVTLDARVDLWCNWMLWVR